MADKDWSRRFADPVPLPDGDLARTLWQAASYIETLPEAEQQLPHWQAAVEALILVAEHGGDPMLPHIAMMRAVNHGRPAPEKAPRRKAVKAFKIIR